MQYLKVMFKGPRSYLRMTVYNDDYRARMPLPFEVINYDTCNDNTRRDMELSRKTHREF